MRRRIENPRILLLDCPLGTAHWYDLTYLFDPFHLPPRLLNVRLDYSMSGIDLYSRSHGCLNDDLDWSVYGHTTFHWLLLFFLPLIMQSTRREKVKQMWRSWMRRISTPFSDKRKNISKLYVHMYVYLLFTTRRLSLFSSLPPSDFLETTLYNVTSVPKIVKIMPLPHFFSHPLLHFQIVAFKPDIVITEKGVSDLAQHYFVKAGITAFRRYAHHLPVFACLSWELDQHVKDFLYRLDNDVCFCFYLIFFSWWCTNFSFLRLRKTDQNRIARATGAVVVTRTDEIQVHSISFRVTPSIPYISSCPRGEP